MSAFMDTCTIVGCPDCDIVKHFDRWGEAEIFMDEHNEKYHKENHGD